MKKSISILMGAGPFVDCLTMSRTLSDFVPTALFQVNTATEPSETLSVVTGPAEPGSDTEDAVVSPNTLYVRTLTAGLQSLLLDRQRLEERVGLFEAAGASGSSEGEPEPEPLSIEGLNSPEEPAGPGWKEDSKHPGELLKSQLETPLLERAEDVQESPALVRSPSCLQD